MADAEQKMKIHGYYVYYTNDAKDGAQFLYNDCDADEAQVFFDAARTRGEADFQDEYKRNFTLRFDYSNKKYTLVKR